MVALARACALALLATGCFIDVGLPGDSGAATTSSSSSSSTTADATSTATTTSGLATTTDAGSSSSTSTTDDATTAAPVCSALGEACSDAEPCCGCLACDGGKCSDSDACGPCQTCTAPGACEPADPGTACAVPSDACMNTIWGVADKSCFAADYATGKCDDAGKCVEAQCDGMGAILATCINGACIDKSTCAPGVPVDSLGAFCIEQGQTPDCTAQCTDSARVSILSVRECGPGGNCMTVKSASCGPYRCDGPQACKSECNGDGDCVVGYSCLLGQCLGG